MPVIRKITPQVLKIFFLSWVIFFLVYDLSIVGFEVITTARLALFFLITSVGLQNGKMALTSLLNRGRAVFGFIFILIFIYAVVLTSLSHHWERVILSRSFWFIIYCFITPLLLVRFANFKLRDFLLAYFLSAVSQSFFVYASIYFPGYRSWLEASIALGGNIDAEKSFRSFGLSGTGGAILSLQLALGFISGLLYLNLESNKRTLPIIFLIFIGLALIFFSEIFVGRTGLLICISVIPFFIAKGGKYNFLKFVKFLFAACIAWVVITYLAEFFILGADYSFNIVFDWTLSVFDSEQDATVQTLISQLQNVPTLSYWDLIFGTGMVSNTDGSNFSGSDSGYIQTYVALGFVFASLFYGTVFFLLYYLLNRATGLSKWAGWLLIGICFIVEFKEPFIHKYSIVQFLVTLFLISANSDFRKTGKSNGKFDIHNSGNIHSYTWRRGG